MDDGDSCLSLSSGTLGRVPEPRSLLSRKRESAQGRTDHFSERPRASQPLKQLQVSDAPGAEQLEARDRGGASPPSPGDPQGASTKAHCTGPGPRPSLTQCGLPTSVSRSGAHYSQMTVASPQPTPTCNPYSQSEQSATGKCLADSTPPGHLLSQEKRTPRSMRLLSAPETQPSPALLQAEPVRAASCSETGRFPVHQALI